MDAHWEDAMTPAGCRSRSGSRTASVICGLLLLMTLMVLVPLTADAQDLDCSDIGTSVSVGASDPHGLDADGDGVGCETWNGGVNSYNSRRSYDGNGYGSSFDGGAGPTSYAPERSRPRNDETNWWPWIAGGAAVLWLVGRREA